MRADLGDDGNADHRHHQRLRVLCGDAERTGEKRSETETDSKIDLHALVLIA